LWGYMSFKKEANGENTDMEGIREWEIGRPVSPVSGCQALSSTRRSFRIKACRRKYCMKHTLATNSGDRKG
jgi:hypothetical protein